MNYSGLYSKFSIKKFLSDFGIRRIALSLLLTFAFHLSSTSQVPGEWQTNLHSLPQYRYTGPFVYSDLANRSIPDDPWFLLGNYRLIVFSHVSGNFEIVTGERVWAKTNHQDGLHGENQAILKVGNKTEVLTGIDSKAAIQAEKIFGTGFAHFSYISNGISCERILSVSPSDSVNQGTPALLVKVILKNKTNRKQIITYTESVAANYRDHKMQFLADSSLPVRYIPYSISKTNSLIEVGFNPEFKDPHYIFREKNQASKYEIYPPSVYLTGTDNINFYTKTSKTGSLLMNGDFSSTLAPGDSVVLYFITGLNFGEQADNPERVRSSFLPILKNSTNNIPFLGSWAKKLPDFSNENNDSLKQEMIWNAYHLEAMATYSSFYGETYIPQGTAYEFSSGSIAASRDHLQHSLPLCYYNPQLAASILSYIMKKMPMSGEITIIENGYGMTTNGHKHTSDQQLFLFMAVSEYLRITKDYNFLMKSLSYYPPESNTYGTVYDHVENAYRFLRDDIGTGLNGLIKLRNSDWNDQMYAEISQRGYFHTASSHLNTAIGIVYLNAMADQMENAKNTGFLLPPSSTSLIGSIKNLRSNLLKSLLNDLGDREFSRRAWMNSKWAIGDSIMYLAPHGYLLQIPEVPIATKIKILNSCDSLLIQNEIMGARQISQSVNKIQKPGEGENAGFWYALNGPLILGINQIDQKKASKMLSMMSFRNYSKNYPNYWIGHWSGPDTYNSSISQFPGMVNNTFKPLVRFPVFCGHAHAWPLYCYLRMNE